MPNGRTSKTNSARRSTTEIHPSSGNVFADLGVANPDLALAKAELVQRIRDVIEQRKLTQARAARVLGVDQPKVSALVRGQVAGFSIERLFRFLNALGQRVEISVSPVSPKRNGAHPRAIVVAE